MPQPAARLCVASAWAAGQAMWRHGCRCREACILQGRGAGPGAASEGQPVNGHSRSLLLLGATMGAQQRSSAGGVTRLRLARASRRDRCSLGLSNSFCQHRCCKPRCCWRGRKRQGVRGGGAQGQVQRGGASASRRSLAGFRSGGTPPAALAHAGPRAPSHTIGWHVGQAGQCQRAPCSGGHMG